MIKKLAKPLLKSCSAISISVLLCLSIISPSEALRTVRQDGKVADEVKKHLERISLPEGFSISLYAVVPNARHMAVSSDEKSNLIFVGTRGQDVWSVFDMEQDGTVEAVMPLATHKQFTMANGPCLAPDGTLFIAEQNRVMAFKNAHSTSLTNVFLEDTIIVKQNELIPPSQESSIHSARVCKIGPDGKLYISLGQPYNVMPKDKIELYNKWGIGGIIRMNQNGADREVYTLGARNSVGIDFNPQNAELWWSDNQVDGMGDDIPAGEINRQTQKGQHFGYPWYGGGKTRTHEYANDTPPDGLIFPEVELQAHAASLGIMFYTGDMFPTDYRGGLFTAQHGSWDRSEPVGARVMFTKINEDGSAGETSVFAEGWINENGGYNGRPVDVAQLPDGSILISDDRASAIYRVTYKKP